MEFNQYPSQYYDYNVHGYSSSLHWCSRCPSSAKWVSTSLPLPPHSYQQVYPTPPPPSNNPFLSPVQIDMISTSINTIQERVMELAMKMKETNSRMLSSLSQVRSQLHEMQLDSTDLDDANVEEVKVDDAMENIAAVCISEYEPDLIEGNSPSVDMVFDENPQRNITKSFTPFIPMQMSLYSTVVFPNNNCSSGTNQHLRSLPHLVESVRKMFDTMSDMKVFAKIIFGSHNCNWYDTGQVRFLMAQTGAERNDTSVEVIQIDRPGDLRLGILEADGFTSGFESDGFNRRVFHKEAYILVMVDASTLLKVNGIANTRTTMVNVSSVKVPLLDNGLELDVKVACDMFDNMSSKYKYAYSFDLGYTSRVSESRSGILIINGTILMHKIKCLELPFDPGVYDANDYPHHRTLLGSPKKCFQIACHVPTDFSFDPGTYSIVGMLLGYYALTRHQVFDTMSHRFHCSKYWDVVCAENYIDRYNSDSALQLERFTMKSHLDSQLRGNTILEFIAQEVWSISFAVKTQMAWSLFVEGSILPLTGNRHELQTEFGRNAFNAMSNWEIYATFYGPNRAIGSFPCHFFLHNCTWVDTGQGGCVYMLLEETYSSKMVERLADPRNLENGEVLQQLEIAANLHEPWNSATKNAFMDAQNNSILVQFVFMKQTSSHLVDICRSIDQSLKLISYLDNCSLGYNITDAHALFGLVRIWIQDLIDLEEHYLHSALGTVQTCFKFVKSVSVDMYKVVRQLHATVMPQYHANTLHDATYYVYINWYSVITRHSLECKRINIGAFAFMLPAISSKSSLFLTVGVTECATYGTKFMKPTAVLGSHAKSIVQVRLLTPSHRNKHFPQLAYWKMKILEVFAATVGLQLAAPHLEHMISLLLNYSARLLRGINGVPDLVLATKSLSMFIFFHKRFHLEVAENEITIMIDVDNASLASAQATADLLRNTDCKDKQVAKLGNVPELSPTNIRFYELMLQENYDSHIYFKALQNDFSPSTLSLMMMEGAMVLCAHLTLLMNPKIITAVLEELLIANFTGVTLFKEYFIYAIGLGWSNLAGKVLKQSTFLLCAQHLADDEGCGYEAMVLYLNLEDKVLFEGWGIVMNVTTIGYPFGKLIIYIWDPG